jgi:electron transport complex protein RnfB
MNRSEYIRRLAEGYAQGDSVAMHAILECAMSDEEARFILDLPAATATLAATYGMDEAAVETKLMNLAQRGLLVRSKKGLRFPSDPATLHDAMLSSAPEFIPPGLDRAWMELYEGEGWGIQIGTVLSSLPMPVLRTIPIQGSVRPETTLLPYEDIVKVIRAHQDLISIRNCCCRVAAKKCDHPNQVCMQFAKRAEYDLFRGSGRKVSVDEAIAIAAQAGNTGLVPTVSNLSDLNQLDFICFCCGCCCLVINPGVRVGGLQRILAPSRYVSTVDADLCNTCGECAERCVVNAITVSEAACVMVVDRDKCLGCGACVLACPVEGGIAMEVARPPEFIPEAGLGPSSILMDM